jgi:hypothetical protein
MNQEGWTTNSSPSGSPPGGGVPDPRAAWPTSGSGMADPPICSPDPEPVELLKGMAL